MTKTSILLNNLYPEDNNINKININLKPGNFETTRLLNALNSKTYNNGGMNKNQLFYHLKKFNIDVSKNNKRYILEKQGKLYLNKIIN